MTDNTEALPPLPEHVATIGRDGHPRHVHHLWSVLEARHYGPPAPLFTADQMRDYARAALAQRQQVPTEDEAWAFADKVWTEMDRKSMPGVYMQLVTKAVAKHYPKHVAALTAAPSAQHNTIRGDQMAQGQPQGATPGVTPGTEADRPTLSAPSAQAEPVAWVSWINLISAELARKRGGPFDQHTWSEARTEYHETPLYAAPPTAQAEPQVPLDMAAIRAACRAEALEEAAQLCKLPDPDDIGAWGDGYEAAWTECYQRIKDAAIREMK